jgi:hypothetical protein
MSTTVSRRFRRYQIIRQATGISQRTPENVRGGEEGGREGEGGRAKVGEQKSLTGRRGREEGRKEEGERKGGGREEGRMQGERRDRD